MIPRWPQLDSDLLQLFIALAEGLQHPDGLKRPKPRWLKIQDLLPAAPGQELFAARQRFIHGATPRAHAKPITTCVPVSTAALTLYRPRKFALQALKMLNAAEHKVRVQHRAAKGVTLKSAGLARRQKA